MITRRMRPGSLSDRPDPRSPCVCRVRPTMLGDHVKYTVAAFAPVQNTPFPYCKETASHESRSANPSQRRSHRSVVDGKHLRRR